MREPSDYCSWEESVPKEFTGDPLWRVQVYRLALFAVDIAWRDVSKLAQDQRTRALSDQLYRALGSVSANLAEGYSRGTGRDRARFYEYALGSARESRNRYYAGRHILSSQVVDHRLSLLTQIIRLLLTMVRDQRGRPMREDAAPYDASDDPIAK